ncbi:TonB-linked SusC/RagA family outer membrane protein [Chitinophaga niastensis]|uniref:TonB-linked SusC/RagA family outer membrane protein n=1 Tax=Chitinophaga niastensis TaxID=536980 RepID=A0A2P8HTT3_CHINA|nr:SusC/RagA family TonB-linked outer membrane protein [Chitinophaga niastensis]PSL49623.1 TonB-linked SusC/RagA family outer membrane protein [Chitinophaga niastensis]
MKRGLLLWLLMAISVVHAYAQTRTITGKVTDAKDGSAIPGVSVAIKGTGKGALTNADGSYKIEVANNGVLVFSFIGFSGKEVSVGNESLINVSLSVDNKDLSEVVVTALGIKREKRTLGYTTQEVKGDELVKSKEVNFLNGLQGRVAGVQVSNTSGMPGGGSRIVIRGASTLTGNNQPLFVVDGNPIDNNQIGAGDDDPILFGGSTANRGIDIDPNIIETINILRGASATALYGSRAAGGAIIITTKSGQGLKKKGISITASSSINFDQAILPEFQTKYAQGTGGAYYDGIAKRTSYSWGPLIDTLKVNGAKVKTYDPRKDFFKTGTTLDNSLSLTGATDKSNYLISVSSLKQDGIVPHTDFARNSFYVNFSSKLTDKLTVNSSLNFVDSRNNRLSEGNDNSYLARLYGAPITYNLKPDLNPNGSQRMYRAATNNPYWITENTGLDIGVQRFIPNVSFVYTPSNWLTFTERLGADVYTDSRKFHEAIGSFSSYTNGRVFEEAINNRQFNHDFFAQARKSFDNKLDLTVMVGNNIISEYYKDLLTKGNGLSVADFYDISNGVSISSRTNFFSRRRVSVYAQAILEYNRLLSLTITGRNDWTSSLPPGNNSYFYPSVTSAFIFSELPAFKDSKLLSFGKLRVAYTAIGNDAGPFKTSTGFYKSSVADALRGEILVPFDGTNAFALNNVAGNPNLKPESIKEFETGLETKWFNNRISLEVNYYDKTSTNLIFTPTVSAGSGFNAAVVNAGKIKNTGVEVTLNATPVSTKNFHWNIGVNWSKNTGKIIDLAPGINAIQIGGFTSPGIYLVKGQPYGTIQGTRYARDANGKLLIDDSGYPIPDAADGNIGNVMPRWIGGVTNTFSYKNFDLSVTVDGRFGGDIMNFDKYYLSAWGVSKNTEDREGTKVYDGIRQSDGKPNTTAIKTDQGYFTNFFTNTFENLVEDGTFVKLRNVTLAYNFSPKRLAHTPFKAATFSLAGRNLWMYAPNFTGSDPELSVYGSGSNSQGFYHRVTPSTKSFNATLKLTF